MVVVLFVKKKAVVFITAEIIFHNGTEEIHNLMDFLFTHPGDQYLCKAFIAEMLEKLDERTLIGFTIESKKHRDT